MNREQLTRATLLGSVTVATGATLAANQTIPEIVNTAPTRTAAAILSASVAIAAAVDYLTRTEGHRDRMRRRRELTARANHPTARKVAR